MSHVEDRTKKDMRVTWKITYQLKFSIIIIITLTPMWP